MSGDILPAAATASNQVAPWPPKDATRGRSCLCRFCWLGSALKIDSLWPLETLIGMVVYFHSCLGSVGQWACFMFIVFSVLFCYFYIIKSPYCDLRIPSPRSPHSPENLHSCRPNLPAAGSLQLLAATNDFLKWKHRHEPWILAHTHNGKGVLV